MTNVPTWISRMSAVALATASMSAFAYELNTNAPDFIMHKASVSLKLSTQNTDGTINKSTVKTKDVINVLMGRSADAKNEKDEKLGLVTSCGADPLDTSGVELVVYDKKTEKQVSSGGIFVTLEDAVVEEKKDVLSKLDLIGSAGDSDEGLLLTGQAKYNKIGSGCAKDGDTKDFWNKDAVCAKNFKSKSVSGANFLGNEIVMSGKISAGSCQYAYDDPTPNPFMTINKTDDVDGELDRPADGAGATTINYTVTVANAGNVALTNVVVTDNDVQGGTLDCGSFDGTLATGENVECTGTQAVGQVEFDLICSDEGDGSIRNIATATSTEANEVGIANVVDLNCTTDPTGGLAIVKTSDKEDTSVSAGDDINYTITVTNQSSDVATNVQVTDTLLDQNGGLSCDPAEGSDLAIDEVMTCTGTHTVTAQDITDNCGEGGDETLRNIAVTTSDELDNFATDHLVDVNCPVVQ